MFFDCYGIISLLRFILYCLYSTTSLIVNPFAQASPASIVCSECGVFGCRSCLISPFAVRLADIVALVVGGSVGGMACRLSIDGFVPPVCFWSVFNPLLCPPHPFDCKYTHSVVLRLAYACTLSLYNRFVLYSVNVQSLCLVQCQCTCRSVLYFEFSYTRLDLTLQLFLSSFYLQYPRSH